MKASERYKQHFNQPFKNGMGLPMHSMAPYRGERLHPDVERRIAEYRKVPSLYGEPK